MTDELLNELQQLRSDGLTMKEIAKELADNLLVRLK